MSRAYRIRVKESVNRVIRAEDRVSTRLEILEVLPCEEMGVLLEQELKKAGFAKEGTVMVRRLDGVTVSVDPLEGEVTVMSEASDRVEAEEELTGTAWDDAGPLRKVVQDQLKQQAREKLEQQIQDRKTGLQTTVTDKLESKLKDLRNELDGMVNRVTAEALKRKAASMGQIKEMTEDPQTGSLTIVVEV
jgi:FtsH ternary system domain X5